MNLLLVEDDRVVRVTARFALEAAGYQVTECADGTSALRAIEESLFDLVLSDIRLPGLNGIELFRRLRQLQPGAAVVLMTAYANTDDAVAVMREGARDYVLKPFEIDELLLRLGRVRHEVEVQRQLETGAQSGGPRHALKGSSAASKQLLARVEAAANTDVNVLVTGETGTGKDLIARTIHERSRRAGKPFIALNCAAIPENLLEAELFGHERGAFTGADRKRIGRFEAADGGTLFLDEVAELPLSQQAKVLRAIDTKSFEPLGSSRNVHTDVRIISATNSDLAAAIEAKQFRKDLFYRLNVIDVHAPPLRERQADLPLLVADFLSEISVRQQRAVPSLDPCTLASLMAYEFPGNVRELIHALEHAVALAREVVIMPEHLPKAFAVDCDEARAGAAAASLAATVEQFELHYIRQVLAKVGGHRGKAAALLGISRKGLWQKLRRESR
ncbi:MAG: sigma-54-dependent transcriptional regulator [Myxococcaceae bacterium]